MAHVHIAFMSRGANAISQTSQEALEIFDQHLRLAAAAVHQVEGSESEFYPLIELVLRLEQTHLRTGNILDFVDHALDKNPERFVLLRALDSLQLNWGGSPEEIFKLCARFAGRIKDYSRELCFVDAAFRIGVKGKLRELALIELKKHDEPFLDHARADAYLNEWSSAWFGAKDFVVDYHSSKEENVRSLRAHSLTALKIEHTFRLRGYHSETVERLRDLALKRIADSPDDAFLNGYIVQRYLETGKPALARKHWEAMLAHQEFLSGPWRVGYSLTANETGGDLAMLMPYIANVIYYSNHDAMQLHIVLGNLRDLTNLNSGSTAPPTDGITGVECQIVRVIRLMNAVCQHREGNDTCGYDTEFMWFAEDTKEKVSQSGQCESERTADIRELLFSPVPADRFIAASAGN